jgi:hypothetical protein
MTPDPSCIYPHGHGVAHVPGGAAINSGELFFGDFCHMRRRTQLAPISHRILRVEALVHPTVIRLFFSSASILSARLTMRPGQHVSQSATFDSAPYGLAQKGEFGWLTGGFRWDASAGQTLAFLVRPAPILDRRRWLYAGNSPGLTTLVPSSRPH